MSNYSVSLKGIGIENFKAFGKYQHFDLEPITIVTGPNNSGKSALISALELLAKNDIYSHLDFHEGGLDIGDSSQVLNASTGSNQFTFELDFTINANPEVCQNVILHVTKEFSLRLVYEIGNPKSFLKILELKIAGTPRFLINFNEIGHQIDLSCSLNAEIDFNYFLLNYLSVFEKEYYNATADSFVTEKPIESFISERTADRLLIENPKYDVFDGNFFRTEDLNQYPSLKNVENSITAKLSENLELACSGSYSYFYDGTLFLGPSYKVCQNDNSLERINGIIGGLLISSLFFTEYDGLENRFCNSIIEHLINNEEDIKTKERWIDTEDGSKYIPWPICPEFSDSFENFIKVLCIDIQTIISLAHDEIKKTIKLDALRATGDRVYQYKQKHIPLTREIINPAESQDATNQIEFFRKWAGSQRFDFFEDPIFKKIEGVGYRFVVRKNGAERELPDLGYGTRQVLPVILGMFNNKQRPFIIEEPESNLHPKLQSLLADLFVEVKKENPDSPLIIETHSEYLIRKLQYLVAKGEILAENIALTYISNKDGELTVKKMEFRKDGILKQDFGEGFFDESVKLTMDLLALISNN